MHNTLTQLSGGRDRGGSGSTDATPDCSHRGRVDWPSEPDADASAGPARGSGLSSCRHTSNTGGAVDQPVGSISAGER